MEGDKVQEDSLGIQGNWIDKKTFIAFKVCLKLYLLEIQGACRIF
jgi:hypothetical protein